MPGVCRYRESTSYYNEIIIFKTRRNYHAFILISVKNLINLIVSLRFAVIEFFDPVPSVGSIICLRRLRIIFRSS